MSSAAFTPPKASRSPRADRSGAAVTPAAATPPTEEALDARTQQWLAGFGTPGRSTSRGRQFELRYVLRLLPPANGTSAARRVALRLMRLRMLAATLSGQQPGPEASVRKLLADEHGQDIMNLARDLAGPAGLLEGAGPLGEQSAEWHRGWLFAPALTIGGGTSQVQKNILAERVLGLPAEPRVDTDRAWKDLPR